MQHPTKRVVVFTGGGTGGHVFPGLAVMEELRSREAVDCYWIGAHRGMERDILKDYPVTFLGISAGKLRRYFSFQNFIDLFKIGWGFLQALGHLKKLKPWFVFSKGGFVSVPGVWAAKILGIPVFSHESDLSPGLATKLNMKSSRRIYCAYPRTRELFPENLRPRVAVTGNPVRRDLLQGNPQELVRTWGLSQDKPWVLVLGGSQGARQINQLVEALAPDLAGQAVIIHQTGKEGSSVPDGPSYRSFPFFKTEMPHLLAGARVIITRSGAGSLWEMAAVGLPGILIPLEVGSRGDQVLNAEVFEKAGAAVVLRGEVTPEQLKTALLGLLQDRQRRDAMQQALGAFGAAGASGAIVSDILETLNV